MSKSYLLVGASLSLNLSPDGLKLVLAIDGQHTRDGLADNLDLGKLVGSSSSDLCDAKGAELGLQVLELIEQIALALIPELMSLNCRIQRRPRKLAKSIQP